MHSETTQPLFFSFGFRCSSAAFLKKLNLKHESFPFDWLVSRLSVIKDCIETDFKDFLSPEHYEKRHTNTYEMMDSNQGWVCDEYVVINKHYQPSHLLHEDNTYQYYLAMNHHNILEEKDREYYIRCVERFKKLMSPINITPKFYIHITPLVTLSKYYENHLKIMKECVDFSNFIYQISNQTARGLYFIMAKDYNADNMRNELFLELSNGSRIYVIITNKHFVDAGEFFMGTHYQEYNFIMDVIQKLL